MKKSFDPHGFTNMNSRNVKVKYKMLDSSGNKTVNNTKTFVILRHPMSRFLSAHFEKFLRFEIDKALFPDFFIQARKKILQSVNKLLNSTFPYSVSLQDFAAYITEHKPEENFELIENIHWRTQDDLCSFCTEK